MFDLNGRVCVVSGASSGLGAQMAEGFAAQGADVVIMARRVEKLEQVAEKIRSFGKEVLSVRCDVTDTESVDAAAEAVIKKFGKVDILVNCAGSAKNAGVVTMTDDEWDFTIDTDLTSVFKVTRAFSRHMIEKKYGRIINIASMYCLLYTSPSPRDCS